MLVVMCCHFWYNLPQTKHSTSNNGSNSNFNSNILLLKRTIVVVVDIIVIIIIISSSSSMIITTSSLTTTGCSHRVRAKVQEKSCCRMHCFTHNSMSVFLHDVIFQQAFGVWFRYCIVSSFSITAPKLESGPVFTSTPNDSIAVNQGNNLTLECAAEGWPVPHVTWEKYGGQLPMGRFSQVLGKHSPFKFKSCVRLRQSMYLSILSIKVI